jgi:hypothetical protein
MKKAELVKALQRQFAHVHTLEEPGESDRKTRDRLPGAMLFPAVDPTSQLEDAVADEDDDKPYEDLEDGSGGSCRLTFNPEVCPHDSPPTKVKGDRRQLSLL